MQNTIQVYKFGGASVKDADAIRNVAKLLQNTKHRPLVVVISAMGKTTNALEAIIRSHYENPDKTEELITSLIGFHEEIATDLLGENTSGVLADLGELWVQLQWILEEPPHYNYDYEYDQIIVFGELASTILVSAYLHTIELSHLWIDARECIKTDDTYRDGQIQWELTQQKADSIIRPALDQYGMIITQGFIGSTAFNESTSLGREGSDYTAAILANVLDATDVTIWKDVPGIMTGDPQRFSDVVLLPELSYREAIEMTYYGAKVIHPKTIKPLQNKEIPLWVRPFDRPDERGTKISSEQPDAHPPIIVHENDQVLIQFATRDFSFVAEHHLGLIFGELAKLRIKVNSMRNTAVSFLVSVKNDQEKLNKLKDALTVYFTISETNNLELVTIRHANEEILTSLKQGRKVLFEERFGNTVQFILK